MPRPAIFALPISFAATVIFCSAALSKPVFNSSVIQGDASEVLFCDLDGDQMKDVVLVNGLDLSIFYQDSTRGFSENPQQHRLDERPCVICPARLGTKAESLVILTTDGLTVLNFTNRTTPPAREQIIKQPTILPEKLDQPRAIYIPLAANAGIDWPLLLVPVASGLQVWRHREFWLQEQLLEQTVKSHIQPSVENAGYSQSFSLSICLEDCNGDQRDDLMVMRNVAGGMEQYSLYLQQRDGLFLSEPALTYSHKADWLTSLYWKDLNRDGKVDLLKSTFLDEPSFVPGMRSGKVLVETFLADAQGGIPKVPQQIFRKNDFSAPLPVVDLDGDGFVDLVLGYIPLNPREGFRKIVTAQQIDFTLKCHCFRPVVGFPKEPDFQRDLLLHFDKELFFSFDRRLYYEQFINLNGDFNADGKKDLLVKDRKDGISVYFFASRQKGFNSEADVRFSCPEPIDRWEVMDLNGDGASDLVVKLSQRNTFRIFISQGKVMGEPLNR